VPADPAGVAVAPAAPVALAAPDEPAAPPQETQPAAALAPAQPSVAPGPATIAPPDDLSARVGRLERLVTSHGLTCTAGCSQKRDDCCWPVDPCGRRYGRVDLTLEATYTGTAAPDGPFGLAVPGAPAQMSWDALDYGFNFAGRGTLRYWVRPQHALELRGSYLGSWDDSARSAGTFGFRPGPGGLGGQIAPNSARLHADAKLYSGELNYWMELACRGCTRFDLLLGARWLQFNENASATDWAAPILPGAGPPFVRSEVENRFLGGQIGGAIRRDVGERFTLSFVLKGLVGGIRRKADVSDANVFAGGTHSASSTDSELVLGMEAELGFRWRLSSRMAITGGYTLTALDNVLRAHDAMDFTQSTSGAVQARQQTDQLIAHTFFVGLNLNF
jgi:hypothetical protein